MASHLQLATTDLTDMKIDAHFELVIVPVFMPSM